MRAILKRYLRRSRSWPVLTGLMAGIALPGSAEALTARETDYQDWRVRCETPDDGGAEQCVMFQVAGSHQTSSEILQIVVRYVPNEPMAIAKLSVPLGVYLPNGLVIKIDDQNPLRVAYEYCDPSSCSTRIQLSEDLLRALKIGESMEVGIVQFINAKEFSATISLKGFTAAFSALR